MFWETSHIIHIVTFFVFYCSHKGPQDLPWIFQNDTFSDYAHEQEPWPVIQILKALQDFFQTNVTLYLNKHGTWHQYFVYYCGVLFTYKKPSGLFYIWTVMLLPQSDKCILILYSATSSPVGVHPTQQVWRTDWRLRCLMSQDNLRRVFKITLVSGAYVQLSRQALKSAWLYCGFDKV